jgi:RNA polymerase primary sigma factor
MNMDKEKELKLAYEALSADEEFALTKAVQDKGTDCDEMKRLREVYNRFVTSIAKEYLDEGLSLDKLVEAGMAGLAKAALKYDHSHGFRFISYAVWWIRQSILQAIEEK